MRALQLKVTLEGIRPPIWRRVVVRDDVRLDQFHELLQVVMGWTNSHLHAFVVDKTRYGIPDDEWESDFETKDESRFTLGHLVQARGAKFSYEYDFGERWIHEIVVEEARPAAEKSVPPRCAAGARACPPEDVGSLSGYENFLWAIRDPKHPEHQELLDWIGGKFDPEAFSVEQVNREIDLWRKHGLPSSWGEA